MRILDKIIGRRRALPIEPKLEAIELTHMEKIPRGTPLVTISMRCSTKDAGYYARTAAELIYHAAGVADYDSLFHFFCDIAHLERWFKDAFKRDLPSKLWWYGEDGYTDLTDYDQRRINDYYLITYYPDRNTIALRRLEGLGENGWQ